MRTVNKWLVTLLMTAAIATPVLISGCTGHVRVYDSYYHDYHPWDRNEVVFYGRWENETHRDHMDYDRRTPEDQHAYWDWRHKH